ncbi:MAG: hypothetical protein OEZ58_04230 [Gammaproteobacteria bacterium]|nr:hypothetical protein [Gammaproteobacteria bacterium]
MHIRYTKLFTLITTSLLLTIINSNAYANSGTVKIESPKDGDTLYSSRENVVKYQANLGSRGNHMHIWVDGEKGPSQRALQGAYTLPTISPGKHAIIIKVVDKGHVPTGPEHAIFVNVEE